MSEPRKFFLETASFFSIMLSEFPKKVAALQWATTFPDKDGAVCLEFDEPQRAVTLGQAVVLYDGDIVLGGGTVSQIF